MLSYEDRMKHQAILQDLLDDIKKKAKRIEELEEENERLRMLFKQINDITEKEM